MLKINAGLLRLVAALELLTALERGVCHFLELPLGRFATMARSCCEYLARVAPLVELRHVRTENA